MEARYHLIPVTTIKLLAEKTLLCCFFRCCSHKMHTSRSRIQTMGKQRTNFNILANLKFLKLKKVEDWLAQKCSNQCNVVTIPVSFRDKAARAQGVKLGSTILWRCNQQRRHSFKVQHCKLDITISDDQRGSGRLSEAFSPDLPQPRASEGRRRGSNSPGGSFLNECQYV